VVLRSYLRQRQMLIRYAGQHVQHLQKALEQMNVKLTEVVSDITGVTGLAILRAILAGQRDPLQLAKLRHARCHRTEAEIARALHGNWRAEHLFALRQALELYETYQAQLRACDDCIERHLQTFADQSGGQPLDYKPRRRSRQRHEPAFDVRAALFRFSGVDLTLIEGIDRATALTTSGRGRNLFTPWPGRWACRSPCRRCRPSRTRIWRSRATSSPRNTARATTTAAGSCRRSFAEGRDIGNIDVLTKVAGEVGLDGKEFEGALRNRKYRQAHRQALRHAYEEAGVTGVRTFVIGGQVLNGLQDRETLAAVIDEEMN
jgi:hypothetical protein